MKNKLLIFLMGFFFCAGQLFAQDPIINPPDTTPSDALDTDIETQILIENLVDDADATSFEFDTEFEHLNDLRKNKLDINRASQEDLARTGLLSPIQIQALLNYRKRMGQIYSFYELQGVAAFDRATIFKLLPYITLEPVKEREAFSLKRAFKYSRNQVFLRYSRTLELAKGYIAADSLTPPKYQGSPDKIYLRYRLTYKDRMSFGMTLEKDAGEQYLVKHSQNSSLRLPDYYSMHFYLKDLNKWVKALAIGDYQVYFGQGLTIWGGFGIRKGATVMNIKRLSPAIRPYTSVNEFAFMRGAAATLGTGRWETTVFASHRFRDANVLTADTLDDASLDVLSVSSLQETGLHRTQSEIDDNNSTEIITTGANLRYSGDTWKIGGNFVYTRLSDSLTRGTALYQKYNFAGRSLMNASIDYAYLYKNMQLFGETAISSNGALATLNGMLVDLDPRVSMALMYRNYARDYQTLNGNAFAEGSNASNEKGLYMGLKAAVAPGLVLNSYFDVFSFPWMKSNIDGPSHGYEYLFRADYTPSYRWGAYLQYRYEQKERNLSDNTTPIDFLIPNIRQNLRLHMRYAISKQLELRTRVEFSWFEDEELAKGFMMYQDIVYKPKFMPLTAQFRWAVFDTDNYDTRIYAYENDVLYAFSVPAYYGRGTRFYANFSYRVSNNISIWFRFAQTYFSDRNEISSGNDLIKGNRRSEVKFQIRASF